MYALRVFASTLYDSADVHFVLLRTSSLLLLVVSSFQFLVKQFKSERVQRQTFQLFSFLKLNISVRSAATKRLPSVYLVNFGIDNKQN
jgi:hypothetical protein